jgi:DNA-binding NarL/FixJ family response regulator
MDPVTVGIVEDNPLLAQGIREKLALNPAVRVTLQASNGRVLLDQLTRQSPPQVLLMDIEMDEMDGITATREVKRLYPHVWVLMLTVFDDEEKLFEAIKAGASGYLLKDEKPARLLRAIDELQLGGSPMSPAIATKVLHFLRTSPATKREEKEEKALTSLTAREKEVLEYLKEGISMRQISERMFVSERTVHKHLEHIYQKLHVSSSREALAKLYGSKK